MTGGGKGIGNGKGEHRNGIWVLMLSNVRQCQWGSHEWNWLGVGGLMKRIFPFPFARTSTQRDPLSNYSADVITEQIERKFPTY